MRMLSHAKRSIGAHSGGPDLTGNAHPSDAADNYRSKSGGNSRPLSFPLEIFS